jgi:hypothetical protein
VTYAGDLLAVAKHLANEVDDTEDEDGRPALPAALPEGAASRRSASTAYYAVFHRIVEVAIATLMPGADTFTQNLAQRAIPHTCLKSICTDLSNERRTTPPKEWRDARLPDGPYVVAVELRELAQLIVKVHKRREIADYVPTAPFGVVDGWNAVRWAERVFELIAAPIPEPQWTLFLASLLLRDRRPDQQE